LGICDESGAALNWKSCAMILLEPMMSSILSSAVLRFDLLDGLITLEPQIFAATVNTLQVPESADALFWS
jgi:hypothetical protein